MRLHPRGRGDQQLGFSLLLLGLHALRGRLPSGYDLSPSLYESHTAEQEALRRAGSETPPNNDHPLIVDILSALL